LLNSFTLRHPAVRPEEARSAVSKGCKRERKNKGSPRPLAGEGLGGEGIFCRRNPLLSLRDILSRLRERKNKGSPRPLAGEGLGERVFSAEGTLSCRYATSSPVCGRGKIRNINTDE